MLCYAMLCYVMLSYIMLCYVVLCYVMLCSAMLYYVMLCYAMLCYVMLCYVKLCYVMLCYVMLCCVVLCCVVLCCVVLCCVVLCCVVLCCVVLCGVVWCCVVLCYVMLCSVLFCCVMLCYVMLCYVLLCSVLLCYVVFCSVVLCCVMLCYVMFCYVLSCSVLFCHVCACMCVCICVCISLTGLKPLKTRRRGRTDKHPAMSRILLRTVLVITYWAPGRPSTTDRAQPDEETRGVGSTRSAAAAGSLRDSALPELGLGLNPILTLFPAEHAYTSALCFEYLMRFLMEAPAAKGTEVRRSARVGLNTAQINSPPEAQTLTVLPRPRPRASVWPEDLSFCHQWIIPGTSTEAKAAQRANAVRTCNGQSQIEPFASCNSVQRFKSAYHRTEPCQELSSTLAAQCIGPAV